MDFKELAEKFFKCHNEPSLKAELPPSKFFLELPSENTSKINHYQDSFKKSLEYIRVERRCARSKGIWKKNDALCEVTKVSGNILKNFGFQDKNGIYLSPEETLFLVEQNKLELTNDTKQVSVYEAYDLVLNHISLNKYRVYKTLVEQGYKLLNKHAIKKFYHRQKINKERSPKKRKRSISTLEIDGEVKKSKKNLELQAFEISMNNQDEKEDNFVGIFDKLAEHGPEHVLPCESSKQPDYFGFLPVSECKDSHDFNLYIREETDLKDLDMHEDVRNIFAICTNDSVAFDRHLNVNISPIN